MKNRIKVRFNLGRGKHYMKWKIQSQIGLEYHYPDDVQLIMHNCTLKNNRKVAERIHAGENKDVCAWILCESITIKHKDLTLNYGDIPDTPTIKTDNSIKLRYNPRIQPYWECRSKELTGDYNLDNKSFNTIVSQKKELFIITNP